MRGIRGSLHRRCNQQLRLAPRWRSRPAGRPGLRSPRAPPGGRQAAPRAGARRRKAAWAPLLFNRDSAKPPTSSNPPPGCNSRTSAATIASASGGQNALSVWVWAFPRARRPRARWAKRVCHSRPPCPRGTTPPRPVSSSSAHGPSLCSPTRSRGPPSLSLPLPLAAKPGTARQPSAVGRAAFPAWLRGPSCCARSSRRPSGLGTGEGAPFPAQGPRSGLGSGRAPTPALPQPAPAPGTLPESRVAASARAVRGRPGHPEPRPASCAAALRGPGSPLLLPPGLASRGRREGAVHGGAVQTCWERFLGSDL